MKTPLILNLVWAGVAGAAFYTGYKLNSEADSGAGKGTPVIAKNTTSPIGAGGPVKGVNPLLVSKDQAVIEFYKQYGLDTGVPLTPDKMKEAMLAAIRESDPVKSQLMFARLMEELNAENAPAALAMVRENVGGFDSMRYIGMLAYKWGEVDPVNAMAELSKSTDRGGRGGMSQSIALTGWAAKDPKGAMAWLEAYEGEGREKEWMAMSLVNGLARSDADAALKYAAGLEDEGARRNASESIAREMIRAGGLEKATAWMATLKDPEMMRGAFQTLSDQMLRSDPAKAAEFVKQYADAEYARGAIGNIAETMARKDVKQGLDFANSLSGKAQSRAVGSVVNEWLDQNDGANALEATKYVEGLPPGDNRDAGARAIAGEVSRDDPQTAIAWASSIQDPELRTDALIDAGRSLNRQDPAAYAAWVAGSGLSAEDQQRITNPQRGDWGGGGFGGGGFPGGGRGNRGGGATGGGGGGRDGGGRRGGGGGGR